MSAFKALFRNTINVAVLEIWTLFTDQVTRCQTLVIKQMLADAKTEAVDREKDRDAQSHDWEHIGTG